MTSPKKAVLALSGVLAICAFLTSCASPTETKQEGPAQTKIVTIAPEAPQSAPGGSTTLEPAPEASSHPRSRRLPRTHASKKRGAEVTRNIVALPASTLQILGDSTVRKFSSTATELGIRVTVEPPPTSPEEILRTKLSEFLLVIPVKGLKSGTGLLDEHMDEALKSKEFPEIRGVVRGYEINGKNPDGSLRVTASVELTIAGVSKTVPVDATLSIEGQTLRIQGEKQLLMTDFNINPPTLMLGTIKAYNPIVIRFNLLLGLT